MPSIIFARAALLASSLVVFAWSSTTSAAIRTATLVADRPTTTPYSTPVQFQSDPSGMARIVRTGVGRYTVDLGSFLPTAPATPAGTPAGTLGSVQVTAGDVGGRFCQVVSWRSTVNVACFDRAGAPADGRFSLLAMTASPGDDVAYAWAHRPATSSYPAQRDYALGPAGGTVTVTRSAPGTYSVMLGAATATVGANIQVSAYGAAARRCQIARWGLGAVAVQCRDATGRPADTAFTVLAWKAPVANRDVAYAWSDNATLASFAPDARYAFAPEAAGGVRVSRSEIGRYAVRIGARVRHVQVSAYGSEGAYCNAVTWTATTANIVCHDSAGAPVNARFSVLALNANTPPAPLFGFVDLHTHPASFLGFGGRDDGRQGMMWGRPAVGAGFRGTRAVDRFGECRPADHSVRTDFLGDPDSLVQDELRKLIIRIADERTRAPHTSHGAAGFEDWPHSLIVTHQQIDIEWLRRAHQGGLRAIVAAAVDNELIDTAYDWNLTSLLPLARDFFAGRPLRAALGMPRPGFAIETSRQQLRFLRMMVEENCDFMEIALSGAEARRIVSEGKMAVILGLELDTLTPVDIETLVAQEGVRFVTPIHFVNNAIGGAAAYETMFSLLSGVVGEGGRPYVLVDDPALDFRIGQVFGRAMQAEINALTASALGWPPIGETCAEVDFIAGRPGCSGKRNSLGLTEAGEALLNRLIAQGVMIDTAHMSQASQEQTLRIAETLRRPIFNSHTGMRADTFQTEANERAMPAGFARRLLDLGGVIGVGTGVGELNDPRRIFYNAGNPLIDFRNGRREWSLDLRQAELQQNLAPARFSRFRVTLRIGSDNMEPQNTVTATLLSRSGVLGTCVFEYPGRGVPGHTVVQRTCPVTPPGATVAVAEVHGLRLEHTAANCGTCTPDNVNIDEVVVEADTAPDARGWLTLLQRTGGHESEVVRLKAPGPAGDPAFGSHYWVTRLLPRAAELGNRIRSLRVRTFTNEDDLGGSAPARVTVGLSGHRESSPEQDLVFAEGGAPAGTFTAETLRFLSGGERLLERPDRAPGLSFGALTLGVGAPEGSGILGKVVELRRLAEAGTFLQPEVHAMLGLGTGALVATAGAVASWAIADPVTAGLAVLIGMGIVEMHDNWSSLVAIDAIVTDTTDGRERQVPFLVGYNPMQRIKGAQATSTLFRGLPERIDAGRLYGGLVINFTLTTQADVKSVDGDEIEFEIVFSDGNVLRRRFPRGHRMPIGEELRMLIPFDMVRAGRDLVRFRIRGSDNVLVRSLDVGLMKDPATSFAEAFADFDGLGAHPGQIGFGSDLSGFEALTPFSAFNPGFDETRIPPTCAGTVVAGECRAPVPIAPVERVVTTLPPYFLDVARVAGRPDPARAIPGRGVPASLPIGRVDGPATRLLDFRQSGLSTVGQLPELAVVAAQADRLRRGAAASLGREMFSSVDGLVRAWERLDTDAIDPPLPPPWFPLCR